MPNRIITPTSLSKRWDLSISTIYRMEKASELPPRKKVHKSLVWFESDIEEYENRLNEEANQMELVK